MARYAEIRHMVKQRKVGLFFGAIVLCLPISASADALFLYMAVPTGQTFLLPVVVIIEGLIIRRLAGGRVLATMFQSFVANITSTIIGAVLYILTLPLFDERLFLAWYTGAFESDAIGNAFIALGFAGVLWIISWASETAVVAALRKVRFNTISSAVAWANVATYLLLLGLAMLLGLGLRLQH